MTDQGFFGTDRARLMPVEAKSGQTIDIVIDVTNPGRMAHCHIAEHTENGMLFSLNMAPRLEAFR